MMYLFTPSSAQGPWRSTNKMKMIKDVRWHSMTGSSWRSTGKHSIGSTICCPTLLSSGEREVDMQLLKVSVFWRSCDSWSIQTKMHYSEDIDSASLCGTPRPIFPSVFWKHKSRWVKSSGCGTRLCSSNMFTWSGDGVESGWETSPRACSLTLPRDVLGLISLQQEASICSEGPLTIKNWPNGKVPLIFIIGCSKGRAKSRDFPTQNF